MTSEQARIVAIVRREGRRLRNFIRRRVLDAADAEDIFQDALYELVAAERLMQPIEQAGSWLLRVARNRIIDRFRRRRFEARPPSAPSGSGESEDETVRPEDLLPALGPGPDGEVLRQVLLEQVEEALDELPPEQRAVFIAHELEGATFKELAERWGVGVNTLLARKRYAILSLRARLQEAYDEWLE